MRHGIALLLATGLLLGTLGCAGTPKTSNMDAAFIRYDTNHDGVISKQEFKSHWQDKEKADKAWKLLDKDQTGALSRDQAKALPLDVWGQLDTTDI